MFNIIIAHDNNDGIGKNNSLPWNIPDELKYFKKVTTHNIFDKENIVIMGRKTHESLPSNFLPGRINIVITSQELTRQYLYSLRYVKNFNEALDTANEINFDNSRSIWVIGGGSIYNMALKHIGLNKIYRTKIYRNYCCDTFLSINNYEYISSQIKFYEDGNLKVSYDILKPTKSCETLYLELLKDVLDLGENRNTRNGKTISLFSKELKFSVKNSFPLLTTKRMFWKGIVEELLFFIRGETDSKLLSKKGVNIWNGNTSKDFLQSVGLNYEEGMMGPMYGYQWRFFNKPYNQDSDNKGIDQLQNIIDEIKTNPTSRRLIITDFNPLQANEGVLYPCHSLILQFYVIEKRLSVKMYQRSADLFLGLPFNIASTTLLLYIISKLTDLEPDEVTITLGDCHIYECHIEGVKKQLSRLGYELPTLKIPNFNSLNEVCSSQFEDYKLNNYKHHSGIKASMVV
uniref:Thymidylate synthase n=1 Tax=Megaviridae environmental sample TaxID=1737588 RepID=A0A5J6VJQ5_9VIRU|nr:MAG: thymidylate synthase [Megaviridae environmental sample]